MCASKKGVHASFLVTVGCSCPAQCSQTTILAVGFLQSFWLRVIYPSVSVLARIILLPFSLETSYMPEPDPSLSFHGSLAFNFFFKKKSGLLA